LKQRQQRAGQHKEAAEQLLEQPLLLRRLQGARHACGQCGVARHHHQAL
jgi:hypothetical protein